MDTATNIRPVEDRKRELYCTYLDYATLVYYCIDKGSGFNEPMKV